MTLAFGARQSHPMVDSLLRTRVPRWTDLDRAIDERDDMLDFAFQLLDHDRDRALLSYFQNGLDQLRLVRHIASWRGPIRRMLDFASGYGRLTRFLLHEKVAEELTVSDILEGGMEFQAQEFGVRTLLSTKSPDDFEASDRYDLIFVASLFTHLPEATFLAWLRRLASLLTPQGLLIFTVHDQSLAPARVDGIYFRSESESRVLDVDDYGSTWVTEDYVRAQVAAIDPSFACVRMPRALAEWQDVYVVSPSPIADPRPMQVPKGFVDGFEVRADGVHLEGWATGVTEPADRVEVRLDDVIVETVREFAPRPDVAAWVGVPTAGESGWGVTLPHHAVESLRYQVATISAFTRAGEERILFLGSLESMHGHVARERAKALQHQLSVRGAEIDALSEQLAILSHQRAELEAQIAAMRASRFWKARDQWFAMKRALRITEER